MSCDNEPLNKEEIKEVFRPKNDGHLSKEDLYKIKEIVEKVPAKTQEEKELEKALMEVLTKSIDISQFPPDNKAEVLALSFIGYMAKPIGISEELYKKCLKAFEDNRGKIQQEKDAILQAIEDAENNAKS